jgi:hypothetical protein
MAMLSSNCFLSHVCSNSMKLIHKIVFFSVQTCFVVQSCFTLVARYLQVLLTVTNTNIGWPPADVREGRGDYQATACMERTSLPLLFPFSFFPSPHPVT